MTGSLARRLHCADDAGMTIIEVLVASAVLLLALTAMLGLLMMSTGLSARARAQALAVKTANSLIEQVRGLKYSDLTQTRLDQLASAASGTIGGMTVYVEASTTPTWTPSQSPSVDPPAYQQVRILVRVTGPGFKSFTFSTGTFVKDWSGAGSSSAATGTPALLPTVQFDADTPPAGATARPIWGAVHVGATGVSNMTDVVLTQIYVKWLTSILASSTPTGMTGSCSGLWDTSGVAEGRVVTIYAETWDALFGQDSKSRDFIIDNAKPLAPSGITLVSTTANTSSAWSWSQVMDGLTAAPDYAITWYYQNAYGDWIGTSVTPVVPTSANLATTAFGHYYPAVAARGPRAAAGLDGSWISAYTAGPRLISRPGFTAMTVSVRQQNKTRPFYFTASNLSLSPPAFMHTHDVSLPYSWEYRIGTGAWTAFPSGNPTPDSVTGFGEVTGPSSGSQASLSFRCTASVTPHDGTATVVKSPIMTVANPSGGSSYTLSNFTPDWTAW